MARRRRSAPDGNAAEHRPVHHRRDVVALKASRVIGGMKASPAPFEWFGSERCDGDRTIAPGCPSIYVCMYAGEHFINVRMQVRMHVFDHHAWPVAVTMDIRAGRCGNQKSCARRMAVRPASLQSGNEDTERYSSVSSSCSHLITLCLPKRSSHLKPGGRGSGRCRAGRSSRR